jgi:hypothetical protein
VQVAALKDRSSTEGKQHLTPGAAPGVFVFFVQRRRDTEARRGVRAAGMHEEAFSPSALSDQPNPARKNHMFSGDAFVKMYYFAIEN